MSHTRVHTDDMREHTGCMQMTCGWRLHDLVDLRALGTDNDKAIYNAILG